MRITLLIISLSFIACAKPKISVDPCDEDLGYATRKMHLSNVKFLDEDKQVDWFELYENLDARRKNTAPQKCIPGSHTPTIEQQIERTEHDLKNLR